MNVNKARYPSPGGMDSLNLLLNSHNSNEDSGSKEYNNKKMALGGNPKGCPGIILSEVQSWKQSDC